MQNTLPHQIKVIVGLGNPGRHYYLHRHSIGFRVVDALAEKYHGVWTSHDFLESAEIVINGNKVLLVKPQTYMNSSGKIIPFLRKKGIKSEQILVIHDELERQFGDLSLAFDGSARGHNGLRSLIAECGPDFSRLRFGIGRPEKSEAVSDYVLENFTEDPTEITILVDRAIAMIGDLFKEQS
jgi:PTH1 family peptidyl-tRNA hydrolase